MTRLVLYVDSCSSSWLAPIIWIIEKDVDSYVVIWDKNDSVKPQLCKHRKFFCELKLEEIGTIILGNLYRWNPPSAHLPMVAGILNGVSCPHGVKSLLLTCPLYWWCFDDVCRGSIMVTTSDFQSGRLGSSPCRDHYSMRLDRGTGLIRAFIPPG